MKDLILLVIVFTSIIFNSILSQFPIEDDKGLSDIINNAATALIMAPIASGIAMSLNVNIDPFLMAVAVGASCAFLTPIGHQCNALILGPGGYKFSDYWKMGLPLEILIVILGTPLILYFWPL